MFDQELQKGKQVFGAEGWGLFATDDGEYTILEWDDACVARLAWLLQGMLKRHALSTNFVSRYGDRGLVVRDLTPIDLSVVVDAAEHDTKLRFVSRLGREMGRREAERVPGARPSRLAVMEDVALHAARSLRPYLNPLGIHTFTLTFHFGITSGGECLAQVPNPLDCSFGQPDYEAICSRLDVKH